MNICINLKFDLISLIDIIIFYEWYNFQNILNCFELLIHNCNFEVQLYFNTKLFENVKL